MTGERIALLAESIESHVRTLCDEVGNRHVGSEGNRHATDYFCREAEEVGFKATCKLFDCLEWEVGETRLHAAGQDWPVLAGPYSLACDVEAELACVSTLDDLEGATLAGKVVLLHGDIASEPVMPKGFVFYNPPHHKKLIGLLEDERPAAVLAATGKSPGTAGSVYPFPMFEDGDFDIPSAFMKDVDGARLVKHEGSQVQLAIDSRRIATTACNPVARRGPDTGLRLLLSAHIDAKKNTPGALDNASGVAVLLAVGELLAQHTPTCGLELVAFNGEDYYAVPGQMQYLADLGDDMKRVGLVINLDGAGHVGADIAYSFYNTGQEIEQQARDCFDKDPLFREGPQWPQGDHSMFAMAGRPAIAITSTNFDWLCAEITHTPKDSPSLIDSVKLAKTSLAIADLVIAQTS